jgi:protein SCO1/2
MSSSFHNSEIRAEENCRRAWMQYASPFLLAKVILSAVALTLSVAAVAQGVGQGIMSPPSNVRPPGLKNVGIEQRLNEQLPLDLSFRDETGKTVQLADYFGKKPVILSLVYYRCPMLCSEVLAGLEGSLRSMSFSAGKEFNVLTVSFDPQDSPQTASEKKAAMLKSYKRAGAADGWHFLTGSQESIDALTKAAGFQYEYDPKSGQFAHTTAVMIVTPEGKIAQYYFGVEFPPTDLRLGLIQASQNQIGTLVDQVILYCYHYDPQAGKYGAIVSHILQLGGGLTVLSLGILLTVLIRRGPNNGPQELNRSHQYVR